MATAGLYQDLWRLAFRRRGAGEERDRRRDRGRLSARQGRPGTPSPPPRRLRVQPPATAVGPHPSRMLGLSPFGVERSAPLGPRISSADGSRRMRDVVIQNLGWPLPAESPGPRDRWHAYATWCTAVRAAHGPSTRRLPVDMVRSWAAQTVLDFWSSSSCRGDSPTSAAWRTSLSSLHAFLAAIDALDRAPMPSGFSCRCCSARPTWGVLSVPALSAAREPHAPQVRHRAFFAEPRWTQSRSVLGAVGAERAARSDTTVLFGSPPVSGIEREAWRNKPRVPRRTRALTSHPIVRYIGRDDPARTAAGWQPWADTVAGWLREGRSPTVFIHTPEQRRGAGVGASLPRRRASPAARGRAAARAGPRRTADPLLSRLRRPLAGMPGQ